MKYFIVTLFLLVYSCQANKVDKSKEQYLIEFKINNQSNIKYNLKSSKHGSLNDSTEFREVLIIEKNSKEEYGMINKKIFMLRDSLILQKEQYCLLNDSTMLENCKVKDLMILLFFCLPRDSVFEGYEWSFTPPLRFSNLKENEYTNMAQGKISKLDKSDDENIIININYIIKAERDLTVGDNNLGRMKVKDEREILLNGTFLINRNFSCWKTVEISQTVKMEAPQKSTSKKRVKFILSEG